MEARAKHQALWIDAIKENKQEKHDQRYAEEYIASDNKIEKPAYLSVPVCNKPFFTSCWHLCSLTLSGPEAT